jgi:tRNA(Ile2) C34 agmatinyltransferase TiaS
MATIKNCHSPAGMHFTTCNLSNANLKDCPGCKYGTLDPNGDKWKCADCGREYTTTQLHDIAKLSNGGN